MVRIIPLGSSARLRRLIGERWQNPVPNGESVPAETAAVELVVRFVWVMDEERKADG